MGRYKGVGMPKAKKKKRAPAEDYSTIAVDVANAEDDVGSAVVQQEATHATAAPDPPTLADLEMAKLECEVWLEELLEKRKAARKAKSALTLTRRIEEVKFKYFKRNVKRAPATSAYKYIEKCYKSELRVKDEQFKCAKADLMLAYAREQADACLHSVQRLEIARLRRELRAAKKNTSRGRSRGT